MSCIHIISLAPNTTKSRICIQPAPNTLHLKVLLDTASHFLLASSCVYLLRWCVVFSSSHKHDVINGSISTANIQSLDGATCRHIQAVQQQHWRWRRRFRGRGRRRIVANWRRRGWCWRCFGRGRRGVHGGGVGAGGNDGADTAVKWPIVNSGNCSLAMYVRTPVAKLFFILNKAS